MPELNDIPLSDSKTSETGPNWSTSKDALRDSFVNEMLMSQDTRAVLGSKRGNAVTDLFHSAAYSGLQAPVLGAAQLIDRVGGSHLEKTLDVLPAPDHVEFSSDPLRWHAQQVGGAVGLIGPFLLTHKATTGALGSMGLSSARAETGLVAGQRLLTARNGLAVLEGTTTGFVFDSVLRPVSPNEGDFWTARLKHGLTGAATFGTLTASSLGLRNVAGRVAPEVLGSRRVLTDVSIGTASGIPAGLVSADAHSLLFKGRFATGEERAQSAYTMAFVGGTLSAMHQLPGQKGTLADRIVERRSAQAGQNVLRTLLDVKSDAIAKEAPSSSRTGTLLDRVLKPENEMPTLRDRRAAAGDVEGKNEFAMREIEITVPKKLQGTFERGVDLAYEAGNSAATPQKVAEFIEYARTEGAPLKEQMLQTAEATGDPRFVTLVREAYMPPEGVKHVKVDRIRVGDPSKPVTAEEVAKWKEFNQLVGEIPTDPASYAKFRLDMFRFLFETGSKPETQRLHEWVKQYGEQTHYSQIAGPIDFYFGTSNLSRFVEVAEGRRPPVELPQGPKNQPLPDITIPRTETGKPVENGPKPYERAPFEMEGRLRSLENSTGMRAVTDAVLLADYTGSMSQGQFTRWLEVVTDKSGSTTLSPRSVISNSAVLDRPEIQRAIESGRNGGATPSEVSLETLQKFVSAPSTEVSPLPPQIAEYIALRVALTEAKAPPDLPPHQLLDQAVPRILMEAIQSRYVSPPDVVGQPPKYSSQLSPELVSLMEAARVSRGKDSFARENRGPKNDVGFRLQQLDQVLNIENPTIRDRLLDLGAQDQTQLRNITNKLNLERSAPEYTELLELILPEAKNLNDVKMLFDSMYFGNKADRDARPPRFNKDGGRPQIDEARREVAAKQAEGYKQLGQVLLDSMIPRGGEARARAQEIVDGVISGRIRDPRIERDGPGGRPQTLGDLARTNPNADRTTGDGAKYPASPPETRAKTGREGDRPAPTVEAKIEPPVQERQESPPVPEKKSEPVEAVKEAVQPPPKSEETRAETKTEAPPVPEVVAKTVAEGDGSRVEAKAVEAPVAKQERAPLPDVSGMPEGERVSQALDLIKKGDAESIELALHLTKGVKSNDVVKPLLLISQLSGVEASAAARTELGRFSGMIVKFAARQLNGQGHSIDVATVGKYGS